MLSFSTWNIERRHWSKKNDNAYLTANGMNGDLREAHIERSTNCLKLKLEVEHGNPTAKYFQTNQESNPRLHKMVEFPPYGICQVLLGVYHIFQCISSFSMFKSLQWIRYWTGVHLSIMIEEKLLIHLLKHLNPYTTWSYNDARYFQ